MARRVTKTYVKKGPGRDGSKSKTNVIGAKYWYEGPLVKGKNVFVSPEVGKAYRCWTNQVARCKSNYTGVSKKYYYDKGIRVKYRSREFVQWWLEQQSILKLNRPTVSRLDHSKDYEFGNIKLEEHIDNCVHDVVRRHGYAGSKARIPIVIINYKTKEPLMIAESTLEASYMTESDRRNINSILKSKRRLKSSNGFSFRYLEDWQKDNPWYTL